MKYRPFFLNTDRLCVGDYVNAVKEDKYAENNYVEFPVVIRFTRHTTDGCDVACDSVCEYKCPKNTVFSFLYGIQLTPDVFEASGFTENKLPESFSCVPQEAVAGGVYYTIPGTGSINVIVIGSGVSTGVYYDESLVSRYNKGIVLAVRYVHELQHFMRDYVLGGSRYINLPWRITSYDGKPCSEENPLGTFADNEDYLEGVYNEFAYMNYCDDDVVATAIRDCAWEVLSTHDNSDTVCAVLEYCDVDGDRQTMTIGIKKFEKEYADGVHYLPDENCLRSLAKTLKWYGKNARMIKVLGRYIDLYDEHLYPCGD